MLRSVERVGFGEDRLAEGTRYPAPFFSFLSRLKHRALLLTAASVTRYLSWLGEPSPDRPSSEMRGTLRRPDSGLRHPTSAFARALMLPTPARM